jgi:hypothetical protein
VRQHVVAPGLVIRDADRAGVARAGGGQGLKAETRQDASRAGIPRIGCDEGAGRGVERGEVGGPFGLGLRGVAPGLGLCRCLHILGRNVTHLVREMPVAASRVDGRATVRVAHDPGGAFSTPSTTV